MTQRTPLPTMMGPLRERCEKAEARVTELEAAGRAIIAFEWGKTEDGHEVAPIPPALPTEQVAWRRFASVIAGASPSVGTPRARLDADGTAQPLTTIKEAHVVPNDDTTRTLVSGTGAGYVVEPRPSDASPETDETRFRKVLEAIADGGMWNAREAACFALGLPSPREDHSQYGPAQRPNEARANEIEALRAIAEAVKGMSPLVGSIEWRESLSVAAAKEVARAWLTRFQPYPPMQEWIDSLASEMHGFAKEQRPETPSTTRAQEIERIARQHERDEDDWLRRHGVVLGHAQAALRRVLGDAFDAGARTGSEER